MPVELGQNYISRVFDSPRLHMIIVLVSPSHRCAGHFKSCLQIIHIMKDHLGEFVHEAVPVQRRIQELHVMGHVFDRAVDDLRCNPQVPGIFPGGIGGQQETDDLELFLLHLMKEFPDVRVGKLQDKGLPVKGWVDVEGLECLFHMVMDDVLRGGRIINLQVIDAGYEIIEMVFEYFQKQGSFVFKIIVEGADGNAGLLSYLV